MLSRAAEVDTSWAYTRGPYKSDHSLAVLLDNVQFIYELALAEMELQALGLNYRICNGHREFRVAKTEPSVLQQIARRVAYFRTVGGFESDYFHLIRRNRTRSVNQYLTHWIYPYKGKFHPQMIRAIFNIIGLKAGDTVLDPFVGSGTTALEAQLMGINAIGVDVSPLCRLQSWVKTHAFQVVADARKGMDAFLDTLGRTFFAEPGAGPRPVDKDELDPVQRFYNMALLIGVSDSARRGRLYAKSVGEALKQMIESAEDFQSIAAELELRLGNVEIVDGDARALKIPDGSIDGIVTSPPYSIALDYVENDKHALHAMGIDPKAAREKFIGVRGTGSERVRVYNDDLKQSIAEMSRVLKSGAHAVIVIGNATYQGQVVQTVNYTIDEARKSGLHLVHDIDKIIFGLYNVMRSEDILFFRKELQ